MFLSFQPETSSISLHTLEHVEEDEKAIINLWNHVKPGGLLIYEVPIQAEYPLGVPINPYHLREYTTTSAYNLYNCIESNHKRIEHIYYGCRVFYSEDVDTLRDSIQIWVRKNEKYLNGSECDWCSYWN